MQANPAEVPQAKHSDLGSKDLSCIPIAPSSQNLVELIENVLVTMNTESAMLCDPSKETTDATMAVSCLFAQKGLEVVYLSKTEQSGLFFSKSFDAALECLKIDSSVVKKIKSNVLVTTYRQYYRWIVEGEVSDEISLVVLNECHHLRRDGVIATTINEFLSTLSEAKLLMVTTTPMANDHDELDKLREIGTKRVFAPVFVSTRVHPKVEVKYMGLETAAGTHFISPLEGEQRNAYLKHVEGILSHRPKEFDHFYAIFLRISLAVITEQTKSSNIKSESSIIRKDSKGIIDSAKFKAAFQELNPNELSVAFSSQNVNGASAFAQYLESTGDFERMTLQDLQDMKVQSEVKLEHQGGLKEEVSEFSAAKSLVKSQKRRFILVTDRMSVYDTRTLLEFFTSAQNTDASTPIVELLIGTSIITESISLREVRQLHLLSPMWNLHVTKQMIERCMQTDSHKDFTQLKVYSHAAVCFPSQGVELEEQDQQVRNYVANLKLAKTPKNALVNYLSNDKKLNSIDLYAWSLAQRKQIPIDERLKKFTDKKSETCDVIELKNAIKAQFESDSPRISTNNIINKLFESIELPHMRHNQLIIKSKGRMPTSWVYCDLRSAFKSARYMETLDLNHVKFYNARLKPTSPSCPPTFTLNKIPMGYSIYIAAHDKEPRLVHHSTSNKHWMRGGRKIHDMRMNQLVPVAKELNVANTHRAVIEKLFEENRIIPQITINYI